MNPFNILGSLMRSGMRPSGGRLERTFGNQGLGETGTMYHGDADRLLKEERGQPVLVAEDPLTCVYRGSGRALQMSDERRFDLFTSKLLRGSQTP
jgi:rod shape-determining protein MreB